jgi:hypothetical protein
MDNYDDNNSDDDWILLVLLVTTLCTQRQPQLLSNRLYTGQEYVDDLLNCGYKLRAPKTPNIQRRIRCRISGMGPGI